MFFFFFFGFKKKTFFFLSLAVFRVFDIWPQHLIYYTFSISHAYCILGIFYYFFFFFPTSFLPKIGPCAILVLKVLKMLKRTLIIFDMSIFSLVTS